MQHNFIKNFIACFILLIIIAQSAFSVSAQTRRGAAQTAANQSKKAAACSGAWTGVIKYTRTQTMTNNKTVERVSGRGTDTTDWEMKYEYNASVAVTEAPERNGASVGKASINHRMSSIEKNSAKERNSCDRGKTWRVMTGEFTSKSETTANASAQDANLHVGINADGTYTVSVALPQIKGQTTGAQTATFGNQCVTKEGKNLTLPPTETTVEGNSLVSDPVRINVENPNLLSGTATKTFQNVTETLSWSLQKCGAPLRLIDLKFEHPKFPDFNNWQEIAEQTGTVDGNMVKIKAKILNASPEAKFADVKFKETFKGDKWDGSSPDAPLPGDATVSVRVEAGEERDVEMIWDSSGYAWFDDGRPRLVQRIKAELEENGKKIDEQTKNLKVAPKPVVLVHGLWSNWKAWESWQNILTTAHSYDWKAFPVGEKPEKGALNTGGEFMSANPTNTIFENAQQLGKYIRYAQEDRNAWHVDLVAHSMGGLISRHYIHSFMPTDSPDGRPQVSHLLMLGTPNLGSPCADVMNFKFETFGQNVEAVRQLKPAAMTEFNRAVKLRKGVKFAALAGNPLPVMCKDIEPNDGVVAVSSAIWNVKDNALSKNIHTELTGTTDFSNFVKPRLAVGPKGDHKPAPLESNEFTQGSLNDFRGSENGVMFVNASFRPQSNFIRDEPSPAFFGKDLKLAAKATAEIEIAVPTGAPFGVTLMAGAKVSATLVDEKGAILGKSLADTSAANLMFRTIFIDKPIAAKTVKLKLANTDAARDAVVLMTAWQTTDAGKSKLGKTLY